MIHVTSCPLELRGIAIKTSKNGSVYYVVNVENDSGESCGLYAKDDSGFPQGLKKGDIIKAQMDVMFYQGTERLIVRQLEKV